MENDKYQAVERTLSYKLSKKVLTPSHNTSTYSFGPFFHTVQGIKQTFIDITFSCFCLFTYMNFLCLFKTKNTKKNNIY